MALLSWDPLRGVVVLQSELQKLTGRSGSGWSPAIDIFETPDEYVITAELAGISSGDVKIRVQDGTVSLSGSRQEHGIRPEQYHRIERGHGAFTRMFSFPQPIDIDRIKADSHEGVLTVTLPKLPRQEPRRVTIT